MKFLFALALVVTMAGDGPAASTDDDFVGHGNNPGSINDQEVNLLLLTSVTAPEIYGAYLQWRWPDIEMSQISECVDAAQDACDSTGICSVCVCDGSCSFICRDYFGHCPEAPPACCPKHSDDPEAQE